MFAKLIDGELLAAPGMISLENGRVCYNPGEELLRARGYLPVADSPIPDCREGELVRAEPTWVVRDGVILRVWEVIE